MFVFAAITSNQESYQLYAERGLSRVREENSVVYVKSGVTSLAAGYNDILDTVEREHPDCEAVVLLHQDLELCDESFCEHIRALLRDPTIGIIGAIGAVGVRSIAYWRGELRGSVRENTRDLVYAPGLHEVDAVDGMLLVLSADAARQLRFDQKVAAHFHGYDVDMCFAARAAGFKVVVDDLQVIHHTKGGYGDRSAYLAAARAWRRKWLKNEPLAVRARSLADSGAVALRRDQWRLRSRLLGVWRH
jgi:GT2 family glycosyltransferase